MGPPFVIDADGALIFTAGAASTGAISQGLTSTLPRTDPTAGPAAEPNQLNFALAVKVAPVRTPVPSMLVGAWPVSVLKLIFVPRRSPNNSTPIAEPVSVL